jgi:hypothetical protein
VDWWDDEGLHGKTIYYNSVTGETREPLPYSASGLPLCHDPIYGSGVLGNKCHDELDHDTCEDGFVDSGNGCELIQPNCEKNPELAVCPPVDDTPIESPGLNPPFDDIPEVPDEGDQGGEDTETDSGNIDNGNDNGDSGDSDNGVGGNGDNDNNDNVDSGSGEFFD